MAVKVICHEATFGGYVGSPPEFQVSVPYSVYQSDGGVDDAPRYFEEVAILSMEIGATPEDVYSGVYSTIQSACANFGYPIPTKADMHAYVPTSFLTLLPAEPAIA